MISKGELNYDVAIIGGGPGGSTLAGILLRHAPDLKIGIFEREVFPRDHIGESLLPPISAVLQEMGCWDKVERGGFPVKIGATFTWGHTMEPWIFEFLPLSQVPKEVERPGKYEGWRVQTAWQADRSIYDKILLDHVKEVGAEVFEGTKVTKINHTGDRIDSLETEDGKRITARYYIDASGNAAILRKAMGVKVDVPTALKNIAFWDYWTDPKWESEPEAKATRIHVRSLPYGWMWNIRISPTKYSVGIVCPAEYYKNSGKTPEQMYEEALRTEKSVLENLKTATSRNHVERTTDWSYVVDRTYGENWFLTGEVAGFADPILSAGLTLTQTGSRELAYTIMELDRGELDKQWLLDRYDDVQRRRVRQHMRFADYWYSANGIFENIRENCAKIAEESGVKLKPHEAFQWLGQGGLDDDFPGQAGIGGYDLAAVKQLMQRFSGDRSTWSISGKNVFKLNLAGATKTKIGRLEKGRIYQEECWVRGNAKLPLFGVFGDLVEALEASSDADTIVSHLRSKNMMRMSAQHAGVAVQHALGCLEVLAMNYWVICSAKKGKKLLTLETPEEGEIMHTMGKGGDTDRQRVALAMGEGGVTKN